MQFGPGDAVTHKGHAYAILSYRELDQAYLAEKIGYGTEVLLPEEEVISAP